MYCIRSGLLSSIPQWLLSYSVAGIRGPRNANNFEPYSFVTLFSRIADNPPAPVALRNTWMAPIIMMIFRLHCPSRPVSRLYLSLAHVFPSCFRSSTLPFSCYISSRHFPFHMSVSVQSDLRGLFWSSLSLKCVCSWYCHCVSLCPSIVASLSRSP